ncbi:MAG: hypothetical protein JEZ00_20385 [Anaerolineaceae bacterium]|nr:hypothetical protein [Anaerolineaceae bacterium]
MKKRQELNSTWIDQHNQSERLHCVLDCFQHRGLATSEQIEILTVLGQHPVRDVLKILSEPPGGLRPLIKPVNIPLPGQRGRPFTGYVLCEAGAAVLGSGTRKAPMLDEPVEAAHALMEMQVFIAAYQQGKKIEIEKVIPYDGLHNIRADALFENQILFEMEQQARLNDVPRISDKLDRLMKFFSSPAGKAYDSKVRILFALPANDGKTIKIWQQVLGALYKKNGSMSFELYWQEVNTFLSNPNWQDLNTFTLLEPTLIDSPVASITPVKEYAAPPFFQRNPLDLDELHMVMTVMEPGMEMFDEGWKEHRYRFFQMMEVIYDGSHYKNGPVERDAAFPVISLMLLYRFLHLHQNKPLLDRIQNGYKKVLYSQKQALPFFRDNLTRFYWDVFLRYFNFGRNGPLKVKVEIPNFNDVRSEIFPVVTITDWEFLRGEEGYIQAGEPDHAEKALSWVLEALHIHAFDLELIHENKPFEKKPRSKNEGNYVNG